MMKAPTKILMGSDLTRSNAQVARWILEEFSSEAELTLVHVVDLPKLPTFLSGGTESQDVIAETIRSQAEEVFAGIVSKLPADRARSEVRFGRPAEALISAADEIGADLIVIGPHEEGKRRRRILGSTAERILIQAKVPVLVAGTLPAASPRRILVAIDDSPVAEPLLGWARLLARTFKAGVTVLHVVDTKVYGRARLISSPTKRDELREEALSDAERWLERRLDDADFNGGAVRVMAVLGDPAHEIVAAREALDADLIVMGTRGAGAVESFLLGSAARAVLHLAQTPVFVLTDGSISS